VQSSSLLIVRLHRLNFYVVLRKLIPKLQAFSQSIHGAPNNAAADQRSVAPLHLSGLEVVSGVTLLPQVVTASPRSGTAADCSAETSL
jgi:hypothetical protein